MPGPWTLERFDAVLALPGMALERFIDAGDGEDIAAGDAFGSMADESFFDPEGPEPDAGDVALEPAFADQPGDDPDGDADAGEPEMALSVPFEDDLPSDRPDAAAEIAALLERLEMAGRTEAGRTAEAFAAALAAALPALVSGAVAGEIALATAALATARADDGVTLTLPPDDHDAVLALLEALSPDGRIALETDTDLAPGTAELSWPGGGGEIDQDRLLRLADDAFARRLARLSNGVSEDD